MWKRVLQNPDSKQDWKYLSPELTLHSRPTYARVDLASCPLSAIPWRVRPTIIVRSRANRVPILFTTALWFTATSMSIGPSGSTFLRLQFKWSVSGALDLEAVGTRYATGDHAPMPPARHSALQPGQDGEWTSKISMTGWKPSYSAPKEQCSELFNNHSTELMWCGCPFMLGQRCPWHLSPCTFHQLRPSAVQSAAGARPFKRRNSSKSCNAFLWLQSEHQASAPIEASVDKKLVVSTSLHLVSCFGNDNRSHWWMPEQPSPWWFPMWSS